MIKIKIKSKLEIFRWVEEPKKFYKVAVSSQFKINCKASGSIGNIEWQKLSDFNSNLKASQKNYTVSGNQLYFKSISLSDSGFYRCRAIDEFGKELISVTKVEVLGK